MESRAPAAAAPRRRGRATWALGAGFLACVTAALLALQPLDGAWWWNTDWDPLYVDSGLALFEGDHRSTFYQHPGTPLQAGVAAVFTAAWVVDRDGDTRHERTRYWFMHLEETRPHFRAYAIALLLASVLLVFGVVGRMFGHVGWGVAGGLLMLAAPGIVSTAAVVGPEAPLAALSLAATAAIAGGFRTRSATAYALGAFATGFAITVKAHAVGLGIPLALALLLRPPERRHLTAAWADARRLLARGSVRAGVAAYVLLVVVANAISEPPPSRQLAGVVGVLVLLAGAATAVVYALRRTRAGSAARACALGAAAVIAGMVLPNLFYLSLVTGTLQTLGELAVGTGPATESGKIEIGVLHPGKPWLPVLALAAAGCVIAARNRDSSVWIWIASFAGMYGLSALHLGALHYYAAGVAVVIPLALVPLGAGRRAPGLVAAAIAVLLVLAPFRAGTREARAIDDLRSRERVVNRWLVARLTPPEVAVSQRPAAETTYVTQMLRFTPWAPKWDFELIPLSAVPAERARRPELRIRYFVTSTFFPDPERLRELAGVEGSVRRVAGLPDVWEVVAAR